MMKAFFGILFSFTVFSSPNIGDWVKYHWTNTEPDGLLREGSYEATITQYDQAKDTYTFQLKIKYQGGVFQKEDQMKGNHFGARFISLILKKCLFKVQLPGPKGSLETCKEESEILDKQGKRLGDGIHYYADLPIFALAKLENRYDDGSTGSLEIIDYSSSESFTDVYILHQVIENHLRDFIFSFSKKS